MLGKHCAFALAFASAFALAVCALLAFGDAGRAETVKPLGWNWVCYSAGRDYVDPIVSPGVYPTHHKHDLMGAPVRPTTINALRLRKLPNNCKFAHPQTERAENEGDNEAAWQPVFVYKATGAEVRTSQVNMYYRKPLGVKPSELRPPPVGLKSVIGSPSATGEQRGVTWRCSNVPNSGQKTPIDCSGYGTNVKITFFVPSCSDGRKYASDQSHLVYPDKGGCPASHPRPIPALNMSFGLKTQDATAIEIRSRDGQVVSPHADWFNGTRREDWLHWIEECFRDPRGGCFGTGVAGMRNP